MKKKVKKSFYKVHSIRISDEVWELLKKNKKGTWSYMFKTLLDYYKKE